MTRPRILGRKRSGHGVDRCPGADCVESLSTAVTDDTSVDEAVAAIFAAISKVSDAGCRKHTDVHILILPSIAEMPNPAQTVTQTALRQLEYLHCLTILM